MKSKDKTKKHIKISLKNIIYFIIFVISLLYIGIFYNLYLVKNNVFAKDTVSNVDEKKISNAEPINIDSIISDGEEIKEEYFVEEVELEYITKYRNNARTT